MENKMLKAAKFYNSIGLNVIPWEFTESKKKNLAGAGYDKWYDKDQTLLEVEKLFSNTKVNAISIMLRGDLECIDIDHKNYKADGIKSHLFDDYKFYLFGWDDNKSFSLDDMVIQKTKNNGYHILYRNVNASNSKRLAGLNKLKTTNKKEILVSETVLETRGTRSNLFVYPTAGYEFVLNNPVKTKVIPSISDKDRTWLISQAIRMEKEINAFYGEKLKVETKIIQKVEKVKHNYEGLPPWDDYVNQSTLNDLLSLLENNGWSIVSEKSNKVLVKRPGDTSSDFSGCVLKDSPVPCLWLWSTSTSLDSEKCLNIFEVFNQLEHNGNRSEAAKDLIKKGFGSSKIVKQEIKKEKVIFDPAKFKFDFNEPIENSTPILTYKDNNGKSELLALSEILMLSGAAKSKKSRLLNSIRASGNTDFRVNGFKLNKGLRKVHFDTEQRKGRVQKLEHQMYAMSGFENNDPLNETYYIRTLSKTQRLDFITNLINTGNYDLATIDGVVDICQNYNDLVASQELVDHLMKIADETKTALILCLHLSRSTGAARGHLGGELENKQDFGIKLTNTQSEDDDSNTSKVEAFMGRGAEFDSFEIELDQYGFAWSTKFGCEPDATYVEDCHNRYLEAIGAIKQQPSISNYTHPPVIVVQESKMNSHKPKADEEIPF